MRVAGYAGLTDTKSVENCVCAVRNLCFALPEVTDPTYIARKESGLSSTANLVGGNGEGSSSGTSIPTQMTGVAKVKKRISPRNRSKGGGWFKKGLQQYIHQDGIFVDCLQHWWLILFSITCAVG